MDQPKLERLLRLIMLLNASTYYTVEELAKRMETSPRSIYRYLDTFKSMSSFDGNRYPILLLLNRRAYNLLIEEYTLAERDTRQTSTESWILETEVSNYIGPTRFILGLAADIQIIDSPELKEYVQNYTIEHIKKLLPE